jgi:uncharacterized protein UPF0547
MVRDAIRGVATAIGVITGAGTIVGWIVSTESPAVVLGTAVGYAGMAYCGGFALVGFGTALLPKRILQGLEDERLAKATFRARAFYFGFGCLFAGFFAGVGTDPLDGVWITIGAVALLVVASSAVIVHRNAEAKRRGEYRECPDCAETIKSRARVCRYCGYRFALSPPAQPMAEDATAAVPAPDAQ